MAKTMKIASTQPFVAEASLLLFPLSRPQPPEGGGKPRRRRKRGGGGDAQPKKRKLTAEQVNFLEVNFGNEHKLESGRKDRLAAALGLDPQQVAVWFQNRRARWRSKHLEEEYSRLKLTHETIVVEKCRLEAEVVNLRDQLARAEEEIRKFSEERGRSGTAAFSRDADWLYPFFAEFGFEENQRLLYMLQNSYVGGL